MTLTNLNKRMNGLEDEEVELTVGLGSNGIRM